MKYIDLTISISLGAVLALSAVPALAQTGKDVMGKKTEAPKAAAPKAPAAQAPAAAPTTPAPPPTTPATPPAPPETGVATPPSPPPADTATKSADAPPTGAAPTTPSVPAAAAESPHGPEPAPDATKTAEKTVAGEPKEGEAKEGEGGEKAAAGDEKEGEKEGGEEEKAPWYKTVEFSGFVDGYFSLNTNFPRPNNYSNFGRANDQNNGFSLAQAGISIDKEADPVGGTIWFRFGPQVSGYGLNDSVDAPGVGLEFIRQAYLTWKPFDALKIDFGKFDSPAGAEEIDSHDENYNYTRGLLHWFSQPTYHTGLKMTYEANEMLKLTLLAVNGWSNTIDNNRGKTFGLFAEFTPIEGLTIAPTYLIGPEQADHYVQEFEDGSTTTLNVGSMNRNLRHLLDVWIYYEANEDLSFLGNIDYARDTLRPDYTTEDTLDVTWYGVMLSGRYAFADKFAVSLRGEYYYDSHGFSAAGFIYDEEEPELTFYSGTATLEAAPSDHLLIKLDGRVDYCDNPVYSVGANESSNWLPTVTLGVVAKTN